MYPIARLGRLSRAGVNRLSYGVQSFRDTELVRLGRLHDADRARAAVAEARAAGFDNISLDLMLWLPGQRLDQWLGSVDALIAVGPEHASLYLLEIYPNAPLRDEMAAAAGRWRPTRMPPRCTSQGLARLDRAGYAQYEISNVARPGRQSRHNLKYWQGGSWLGLRLWLHTQRGTVYDGGTSPSTGEYVGRVAAGESARVDVRVLSRQERLEEALFMGLRLTDGLDLTSIRETHGVDVWTVTAASWRGSSRPGWSWCRPGSRLALTRSGMLVANEIMMVFIGDTVR